MFLFLLRLLWNRSYWWFWSIIICFCLIIKKIDKLLNFRLLKFTSLNKIKTLSCINTIYIGPRINFFHYRLLIVAWCSTFSFLPHSWPKSVSQTQCVSLFSVRALYFLKLKFGTYDSFFMNITLSFLTGFVTALLPLSMALSAN